MVIERVYWASVSKADVCEKLVELFLLGWRIEVTGSGLEVIFYRVTFLCRSQVTSLKLRLEAIVTIVTRSYWGLLAILLVGFLLLVRRSFGREDVVVWGERFGRPKGPVPTRRDGEDGELC